MANKLTTFSLQDIQSDTIQQSLESFQMMTDYAVAKGLRFVGNPYVKRGMLLLLKEARVGIVSAGEAIVEIDLTEYHVTKGMIILLPHDTIVNIRSASSDYAINGTVLLPTINVDAPIILHPDDDVHQDTKLTSMCPRLKELNDNPYLLIGFVISRMVIQPKIRHLIEIIFLRHHLTPVI